MATILITCAGSGVGQSVLDSLNLKRRHKLIGCDGKRNVYAHNYCDDFFTAPRIDDGEYINFLLELCSEQAVDIVVPGHDQELLLFSKNVAKFHANDVEVIISKPDLIEISRDKQEWFNYFSNLGCKIVPTFSVKEFKKNPDTSIFPAIVKPAGGSASQGISIINDISELEEVKDDDIIQPYLFPKKTDKNYEAILNAVQKGEFIQRSEISIQLVFTKESTCSGIFISKNTLKDGVPTFVDPIDPDQFEYLDEVKKFVSICEEKGVRGPVNIQGRILEKGLFFFEMNMRFTGITGNRALLGFNEVDYLVSNFLGEKGYLKDYAHNKLGVRQVACTTIPRENEKTAKTYTILGAGGFVGSHFLKSLKDKGNYSRINLICRGESYEEYVSQYENKNVKVFSDSDEEVETIYCQSDVVVNFVSALAYLPDTEKFKSVIFQYQQVQKLVKANVPLVINVSSQSVYDQTEDIKKDENADISIDNVYSFQKYICELFFESASSFSPSIDSISLRFSRVLGGTDRKANGFFAKAVDMLIQDEKLEIPYPKNKTNLIDVRDAVDAINYTIANNEKYDFPELMNVGGANISMKDYCEGIVEELNSTGKRDLIKYSESGEVQTSSMINSDVFRSFGWCPSFSTKDIINTFIDSAEKLQ